MELGIKGKLALVTGAGRGLGEAICYSLAREGVKIIASSRSEDKLRKVLRKLGGEAAGHSAFSVDLLGEDGPQKLIEFMEKHQQKPDILVNNVGGNLDVKDPLSNLTDWRRVMRLNLEVGIELNNCLVPLMQKKKWGRVCHISSIAAVRDRHSVPYSTAKAALNAYVRGLACSVAKDNVVLTTVMPGAMLSCDGIWGQRICNNPRGVKAFLESRLAIGRFATTQEISEIVTFLCSEPASFFCGSAIAVDGGTF